MLVFRHNMLTVKNMVGFLTFRPRKKFCYDVAVDKTQREEASNAITVWNRLVENVHQTVCRNTQI
jgi:hypothetical protein